MPQLGHAGHALSAALAIVLIVAAGTVGMLAARVRRERPALATMALGSRSAERLADIRADTQATATARSAHA